MANPRKLKIHKKYQARVYGNTTIPEIRLEGKWLERLGFSEGEMVIVQEEKYRLIITKVI